MFRALNRQTLQQLYIDYSWLTAKNLHGKWIVSNPDLDGLLSLALIKKVVPTIEFAGFYTGEQLILTPEAASVASCDGIAGFVAVECDLYLMPSVGHHFTLGASRYPHLNPNCLRGFDNATFFTRKFPLNMLSFLWRWFQQPVPSPSDPARSDFLRSLFYPDGVLLKVLQQYKANCSDWLQWLDIGVNTDELYRLIHSGWTIQFARCLYKNFGNTQLGFGFVQHGHELKISDLSIKQSWVNRLCQNLNLPKLLLPQSYHLHSTFIQHRISFPPQPGKSFTEPVVSDALVRKHEWSVTLPTRNTKLTTTIGLRRGLGSEPEKWVAKYNLNGPCLDKLPYCSNCTASSPE